MLNQMQRKLDYFIWDFCIRSILEILCLARGVALPIFWGISWGRKMYKSWLSKYLLRECRELLGQLRKNKQKGKNTISPKNNNCSHQTRWCINFPISLQYQESNLRWDGPTHRDLLWGLAFNKIENLPRVTKESWNLWYPILNSLITRSKI